MATLLDLPADIWACIFELGKFDWTDLARLMRVHPRIRAQISQLKFESRGKTTIVCDCWLGPCNCERKQLIWGYMHHLSFCDEKKTDEPLLKLIINTHLHRKDVELYKYITQYCAPNYVRNWLYFDSDTISFDKLYTKLSMRLAMGGRSPVHIITAVLQTKYTDIRKLLARGNIYAISAYMQLFNAYSPNNSETNITITYYEPVYISYCTTKDRVADFLVKAISNTAFFRDLVDIAADKKSKLVLMFYRYIRSYNTVIDYTTRISNIFSKYDPQKWADLQWIYAQITGNPEDIRILDKEGVAKIVESLYLMRPPPEFYSWVVAAHLFPRVFAEAFDKHITFEGDPLNVLRKGIQPFLRDYLRVEHIEYLLDPTVFSTFAPLLCNLPFVNRIFDSYEPVACALLVSKMLEINDKPRELLELPNYEGLEDYEPQNLAERYALYSKHKATREATYCTLEHEFTRRQMAAMREQIEIQQQIAKVKEEEQKAILCKYNEIVDFDADDGDVEDFDDIECCEVDCEEEN